nr:uncharacterized protein LOC127329060 [Lolium perenne]
MTPGMVKSSSLRARHTSRIKKRCHGAKDTEETVRKRRKDSVGPTSGLAGLLPPPPGPHPAAWRQAGYWAEAGSPPLRSRPGAPRLGRLALFGPPGVYAAASGDGRLAPSLDRAGRQLLPTPRAYTAGRSVPGRFHVSSSCSSIQLHLTKTGSNSPCNVPAAFHARPPAEDLHWRRPEFVRTGPFLIIITAAAFNAAGIAALFGHGFTAAAFNAAGIAALSGHVFTAVAALSAAALAAGSHPHHHRRCRGLRPRRTLFINITSGVRSWSRVRTKKRANMLYAGARVGSSSSARFAGAGEHRMSSGRQHRPCPSTSVDLRPTLNKQRHPPTLMHGNAYQAAATKQADARAAMGLLVRATQPRHAAQPSPAARPRPQHPLAPAPSPLAPKRVLVSAADRATPGSALSTTLARRPSLASRRLRYRLPAPHQPGLPQHILRLPRPSPTPSAAPPPIAAIPPPSRGGSKT